MAQLTAAERLARIKTALGLSGTNYQDDTLQFYIDEVMSEMVEAGTAQDVAESTAAVGCIAIGVNDLWNYSSGGVKHSEAFFQRLTQLSMVQSSGGGGTGSYNSLTDKPSLNGTTLQGDMESDDVGIEKVDSTDIIDLF